MTSWQCARNAKNNTTKKKRLFSLATSDAQRKYVRVLHLFVTNDVYCVTERGDKRSLLFA